MTLISSEMTFRNFICPYISLIPFTTNDVIFLPIAGPTPIIHSYHPNRVIVTTPDLLFERPEFHNYEISMQKGRGDPNKPWSSIAMLSAVAPEDIVTGLEPNTTYAFRVRGETESGEYTDYSFAELIDTLPLGQFTHL